MKIIPNKKTIILPFFILFILVLGLLIGPDFVIGQQGAYEVINEQIKDLNSEIEDKKTLTKQIQNKQEKYEEAIKKAQNQQASLGNQLAIMKNRIAKAELDIEKVEIDIDRVKLEVQKTDIEIADVNKQISTEKNHITNILRLMNEKDHISTLEIMLLNNSLAEFLSEAKYLEDINENLKDTLESMEQLKRQQEKRKEELAEKNKKLEELKLSLLNKTKKLESDKADKDYILTQVQSSEVEYKRLLEQAKKEQQDAASEIASLEKLVRAKLAKLQGGKLELTNEGLIWPVPKNVITSYFHDPEYPFRYIFEHPAIDIRAAQGTTLKAASSGYVARVKNGGKTGYSYIMIIHADGLSTVYGHVSKIFVQEDDFVVQGQTIGQTGGAPGTPGAGTLSTGPHLHFEVRSNGIPVDPLGYLN